MSAIAGSWEVRSCERSFPRSPETPPPLELLRTPAPSFAILLLLPLLFLPAASMNGEGSLCKPEGDNICAPVIASATELLSSAPPSVTGSATPGSFQLFLNFVDTACNGKLAAIDTNVCLGDMLWITSFLRPAGADSATRRWYSCSTWPRGPLSTALSHDSASWVPM